MGGNGWDPAKSFIDNVVISRTLKWVSWLELVMSLFCHSSCKLANSISV